MKLGTKIISKITKSGLILIYLVWIEKWIRPERDDG
jgi:hypothetical protein